MAVSKALENSATAFNVKYACNFDFATFESRVEEFTFLRPNSGWIDVYKMTLDRMYTQALESATKEGGMNLNGEAMLDDFEYTLIRPYVKECKPDIKHKPYVGMDRLVRLEYLDQLTKDTPSNPVDLYTEKYKNGELSIKHMRSALGAEATHRSQYVEIAGYVQALENVNKSRSLIWRAFHPFKNSTEKREAALMKRTLVEGRRDGEAFYNEIAEAAYKPFDGHQRASETLAQHMLHAKEELNREQKMNDIIRESLRVEIFEKEEERAPRVEPYNSPVREKQI